MAVAFVIQASPARYSLTITDSLHAVHEGEEALCHRGVDVDRLIKEPPRRVGHHERHQSLYELSPAGAQDCGPENVLSVGVDHDLHEAGRRTPLDRARDV